MRMVTKRSLDETEINRSDGAADAHVNDQQVPERYRVHRPNENKMSDGGRERAPLGMERTGKP